MQMFLSCDHWADQLTSVNSKWWPIRAFKVVKVNISFSKLMKTHGYYKGWLVSSIIKWSNHLHNLETVNVCYLTIHLGPSIAKYNLWRSIHKRFIRRELLRERFSQCNMQCNHEKWVHNPFLKYSVHAIVHTIECENAPT